MVELLVMGSIVIITMTRNLYTLSIGKQQEHNDIFIYLYLVLRRIHFALTRIHKDIYTL